MNRPKSPVEAHVKSESECRPPLLPRKLKLTEIETGSASTDKQQSKNEMCEIAKNPTTIPKPAQNKTIKEKELSEKMVRPTNHPCLPIEKVETDHIDKSVANTDATINKIIQEFEANIQIQKELSCPTNSCKKIQNSEGNIQKEPSSLLSPTEKVPILLPRSINSKSHISHQPSSVEEDEDCDKDRQTKNLANTSKTNVQERFPIPKNLESILHNKKVGVVKPFQLSADKSVHFQTPSHDSNTSGRGRCRFEDSSPELAFITKDLIQNEKNYITQLEEGLKISEKLKKEGISLLARHKLFGYFQEILTFHREEFLAELEKSETPKQFALCFMKHFSKFNAYIQREWVIPNVLLESDIFENCLIENRNLKTYMNLTKQRVSEYAKSLQCFKFLCEKSKDIDSRLAAEVAIQVIKNLEHQIQMVQNLKKMFGNTSDKFKECGHVLLSDKFKVAIKGSGKKNVTVYFCENIIIFADTQNNDRYQYVDSILTSQTYCCVLKHKLKFEIGIRGGNSFTLTAESQNIKDQWCKELRKIVKDELYKGV